MPRRSRSTSPAAAAPTNVLASAAVIQLRTALGEQWLCTRPHYPTSCHLSAVAYECRADPF
jgi:hypothetical protein